jgi:acetylornithine deacetylase
MGLAERLAELVGFDTQNPDGDEKPLVRKLAEDLTGLGAAAVEQVEVGDHAYVYARFGAAPPSVVFNAHVDTVPANSGYSSPPHMLVRRGERVHGLGAADTKGAIAAILEALALEPLERRAALSLGVLFSGDEEKEGTCVRAFLASEAARGLKRAIVCEPTGCRVGVRHRGIGAATATLAGPGGHSSRVDGIANPVALLARAAVALDEWRAAEAPRGPAGFEGLCLNVAGIDGGVAFNVVPTRAKLMLSLRPAPGADLTQLMAEAERRVRAATAPHAVDWKVEIESPAFATRDLASFEPLLGAPTAAPVDLAFWTEAARMSEAGIDAVVYGPGQIEHAHAADEYVDLAELEAARATFSRALGTLLT